MNEFNPFEEEEEEELGMYPRRAQKTDIIVIAGFFLSDIADAFSEAFRTIAQTAGGHSRYTLQQQKFFNQASQEIERIAEDEQK